MSMDSSNSMYSGRTKYSAFVSKLNKLSEEYLSHKVKK